MKEHLVTILFALRHYEKWLRDAEELRQKVGGSSEHFREQLQRVWKALEVVEKEMKGEEGVIG